MTASTTNPYDLKFDALFTLGSKGVLDGTHHRDGALVDGGRWGISVVLRPDPATAAQLAEVAVEAQAVAGDDHWLTGSVSTSHVTVLPLEPYRHHVPADDPQVAHYATGLATAAARSQPVRLRFGGLTLSPVGILACAYPVDDAADTLATNLKDSIGRNRFSDRDIWYATVLHFTGAIPQPQALIDWVAERRTLALGQTRIDEVDLLGWRSAGALPQAVPLASAALAHPSAEPVSGPPFSSDLGRRSPDKGVE
jgi:hypothetical protein